MAAAIITNGAVKQLDGTTWYDYILNISKLGIKAATLSLLPVEDIIYLTRDFNLS